MPENFVPPLWLAWLGLGVLAASITAWGVVWWRAVHGVPALARRRLRRPPWAWEGAVLAAFYLLNAVAALLLQADADPAEPLPIGPEAIASQVLLMLLFSGSALVLVVSRHGDRRLTLRDFGLGWGAELTLRDLGVGVFAAAAMLPIVYGVNVALVLLTQNDTPHPAIDSLMSDPSSWTLGATAFLAVVAAPLFEEFAFRVLLQGGLQRVAGKQAWWPVAASAVVFGLAHANHGVAPVAIVVLALGIGYVYRQTHSFAAVVAMHAAFNAASLAVAFAAVQAGVEL